MSRFSSYLRSLLDACPDSIATISKNTGIERTSIHKALTGERVISYKALKKLAAYLCLSPQEQAELFRAHSELLLGESAVREKELVVKLLNTLGGITAPPDPGETEAAASAQPSQSQKSQPSLRKPNGSLFHGELAVSDLITQVFLSHQGQKPEAEISMNLPLNDPYFSRFLFHLYQRSPFPLSIRHMMSFPHRRDQDSRAAYGLALLQHILPLCFISHSRYVPYFYFEDKIAAFPSTPLPWYLLSGEYLICLSHDLKTAVLYTEPQILQFYQEHFQRALECCQPFLTYTQDPFKLLEWEMDNHEPDAHYGIMHMPCFGRFFTREFLELKVKKELPYRKPLMDLFMARLELLNSCPAYYDLFSKQGVLDFLRTGVFCDLPAEYYEPCTLRERLRLVQALRDAIADGSMTCLIANPSRLVIPDYLSFLVTKNKRTHISTTQGTGWDAYACNALVMEQSVNQALCRFITSLPGSWYVLSQEETLAFLDEALQSHAPLS